jgi:redox-sensitive bicupin YhaK (pirin superfamily)
MITLRKNMERHRMKGGKHDTFLTFYPQENPGEPAENFGPVFAFNEILLAPGGTSSPLPRSEAEVVTYAYKGALAQEDSAGNSGVVHTGEFQQMSTGRGIRHKETNPSRTDWAHVFRVSMRPSVVGLVCAHQQKRFPAAQRHNVLCVIASADGRSGSLRIHQDALICSSILDPGHHIVHELLPGRCVWLHVIYGEATLQDIVLTQGDGVGVTIEPSVSLTALENTEVLLVDSAQSISRTEAGTEEVTCS